MASGFQTGDPRSVAAARKGSKNSPWRKHAFCLTEKAERLNAEFQREREAKAKRKGAKQ